MNNYYSSNPTFYVSVDCIIFGFNEDGLSLLLLKRNFEPAKGEWSLMGGFIQQNESADEAAKRILAELTWTAGCVHGTSVYFRRDTSRSG